MSVNEGSESKERNVVHC